MLDPKFSNNLDSYPEEGWGSENIGEVKQPITFAQRFILALKGLLGSEKTLFTFLHSFFSTGSDCLRVSAMVTFSFVGEGVKDSALSLALG